MLFVVKVEIQDFERVIDFYLKIHRVFSNCYPDKYLRIILQKIIRFMFWLFKYHLQQNTTSQLFKSNPYFIN